MTVTGKIQGFSSEPRGRVDGLVFVDGTSARAGKRAQLGTLGLKAGDTVTVTGRGGTYPQGKALHIETIKLASGELRTLEPPRETSIPASRDGEISRLLINPHGDVDGLIFKDGTVVRMRPTSPSPQLVVGTKVHAEGAGRAGSIHADRLTTTAKNGAAIELSTPPTIPRGPRGLILVDDSSSVLLVVNNNEGEPDTLVLQDGAMVKLPPRLREQAGQAIKVGMKIAVSGEGGTYGAVKAFRANRVQLASGQIFSEPERSEGPRPPRNVAP